MSSKLALFAVLLLASVSLTSCAALFRGSHDKVTFQSDPAGAKVYINGMVAGTTPFEAQLEAKRNHNVEFKKDGYENRAMVLTSSVGAGWVVLDVLGGLIPVIVDAATGSWNGLDQKNVAVTLDKKEG